MHMTEHHRGMFSTPRGIQRGVRICYMNKRRVNRRRTRGWYIKIHFCSRFVVVHRHEMHVHAAERKNGEEDSGVQHNTVYSCDNTQLKKKNVSRSKYTYTYVRDRLWSPLILRITIERMGRRYIRYTYVYIACVSQILVRWDDIIDWISFLGFGQSHGRCFMRLEWRDRGEGIPICAFPLLSQWEKTRGRARSIRGMISSCQCARRRPVYGSFFF